MPPGPGIVWTPTRTGQLVLRSFRWVVELPASRVAENCRGGGWVVVCIHWTACKIPPFLGECKES